MHPWPTDARHLRAFHDLIKDDLIQRAVTRVGSAGALLDLVVGRGADIAKWYKNGIHTTIGLGLESSSINEAEAILRPEIPHIPKQRVH
jgi:hypothetical protein